MLISAGAVVDMKDKDGMTALHRALKYGMVDCTELLLDAGAKISILNMRFEQPDWFVAMVKRRSNCKSSAFALYGLLRKRWRVVNEKVPLDMIRMLTRMVWDTRHGERWDEVESKKAKQDGPCKHKCSNKQSCGHKCCKRE